MKLELFWKRVNKTDGCWLWTGRCQWGGYGQWAVLQNGKVKQYSVHRFAHELLVGPIPDGLCVCHKCDVRNCLNPDHLFLGTYKDNMQDASKKGRLASGDRNWTRKNPENLLRGDKHPARIKPECWRRGDNHPRKLNPEKWNVENVNTAKVTWEIVRAIRALPKTRTLASEVARQYGIKYSASRRIIAGDTWREPSVQ